MQIRRSQCGVCLKQVELDAVSAKPCVNKSGPGLVQPNVPHNYTFVQALIGLDSHYCLQIISSEHGANINKKAYRFFYIILLHGAILSILAGSLGLITFLNYGLNVDVFQKYYLFTKNCLDITSFVAHLRDTVSIKENES